MTKIEALTAQDRCDRCGAPAVIAFTVKGAETPLLMCGHHTRNHRQAILSVADVVWDSRGEQLSATR
jgi:hypothetical protein